MDVYLKNNILKHLNIITLINFILSNIKIETTMY